MIAGALILGALRGSIVLLIAGIAATALRRRPAALRHSIWSLAIASQIVVLVVALLIPQRAVDLGRIGSPLTRAAIGIEELERAPTNSAGSMLSGETDRAGAQPIGQQATNAGLNAPVMANVGGGFGLLTLLWAIGALLMLVRFAVGTLLVSLETQRATRPISRDWVLLSGQIQEEMNLHREAVLLWGTQREVPYTWGIVSPVVCLPSDADKWSFERLRIVMIHELAHVERFDTFGEFIAQLALVIFWFNPFFWLAVRRMRTEREHACDDRVLMRGVKPSTYVEELVNMMKSIGSGGIAPGFGAIAMARRSQFEARMFAVLDEHADRHAIGRRATTAIAAGMIALVLLVASVRPATANSPVVRPTHSQPKSVSSVKADTWGQSDFDDMVADCKRERSKDKPSIGVRYCEVRIVDVSALTGPVDFRGGYLDGVIFTSKGSPRTPSARALIRADAITPDDARKLASQVRTFLRDGVLQSEGPGGGRSNLWSVLYEVTLPVGSTVKARTELSQISLTDFDGIADVASVNGPVEVSGATGDIRGRTENGPIMVGLGGKRWQGAGLDLRSQNGPIYLSIPEGYSGHLITGTVNGPMDLRYPLMLKRISGKGIDADLGTGGPTVRVTTVNGPADIRER